jgi:hypothetical protein
MESVSSVTMSVVALALLGLAPLAARADTIENLQFVGTATCEPNFEFQECTPGPLGAVTGQYELDVDMQTIVGPWSFETPFGVMSSTMSGASAVVGPVTLINGDDYEAAFQISTATLLEDLALVFPAPDDEELGAAFSPAPPLLWQQLLSKHTLDAARRPLVRTRCRSGGIDKPRPGAADHGAARRCAPRPRRAAAPQAGEGWWQRRV